MTRFIYISELFISVNEIATVSIQGNAVGDATIMLRSGKQISVDHDLIPKLKEFILSDCTVLEDINP